MREINLIINHHHDPEIKRQLLDLIPGVPRARLDAAGALRISGDLDNIGGLDFNSAEYSWYRGRGAYSHFTFLDSNTDMPRIREIFGAPPQVGTPSIKDCIVLTGGDVRVIKDVLELVSSIDGRVGATLPTITVQPPVIAISSNRDYVGWDDQDRYFRENSPWNAWPRFDARVATEMVRLKEYFNGGPVVEVKEQAQDNNRAPDKPTPGNAIILTPTPQISEEVQELLFEAGHGWDNGRTRVLNYMHKNCIVTGTFNGLCSNKAMLVGDEASCRAGKPEWPVFNAAYDMDKLCKFFGVKRKPMTIEKLMAPYLINVVKSTPGDDLVAGFIRRDLGLVLPKEVQDKGAEAIFAWVLEEKKNSPVVVPSIVRNPPDRKFRWEYREEVTGRTRFRRTDTVTAEIEVPQEVIQSAVDEGDFDIIKDWIDDNTGEETQVGRSHGDEETTDSEDTGNDFVENSSWDEARRKFDQLLRASEE